MQLLFRVFVVVVVVVVVWLLQRPVDANSVGGAYRLDPDHRRDCRLPPCRGGRDPSRVVLLLRRVASMLARRCVLAIRSILARAAACARCAVRHHREASSIDFGTTEPTADVFE